MKLHQTYYIEPRKGAAHMELSGEWDYAYTEEATDTPEGIEWNLKTQIPSSVYWSLYHSDVLPHPYEGCNSKLYRWVDQKVWYYRKQFVFPMDACLENAYLCCDGAAYYTRIWVNGKLLGEHDGMFGGPIVEISSLLLGDGDNEIIIEVQACNFGVEDWDCYNSQNTQIVPWNFARDNHTSNGDFIVVGLWRGVRIELLPKLHISRPYLITESIMEGKAQLHLQCEVTDGTINELECKPNDLGAWSDYAFAYSTGNSGIKQDLTVQIVTTLVDRDSGEAVYRSSDDFTLYDYERSGIDPRFYESQFFNKTFEIGDPKLWYPTHMGDSHLYLCRIELIKNGITYDMHEFDYGIRTIALERSAGEQYRTRWGEFQFIVNGQRIFLKGMNWMPVDFLLNCRREDYRWTLELVKNAGIQLVRVWSGGGFYENDDFYELCDEMGIMVWQDSFIANNNTQNWPQDILQSQLSINLYRIRNHPSLAIHCGGNEFNPYSFENAASMAVIQREISDLDPARPFFRTTPDKGSAHIYRDMEPTWYRNCYRQLPFVGESGMHSFPNYKSLRQLISKEEAEQSLSNIFISEFKVSHPELLNHFTEYNPERVPRMLARASSIQDVHNISLPDLVEATQISSCEFYQIMTQAMRENYPITTGLMPWVFRRAWTTVAIQLVDGMGDPIAPYYYLKNAYQPMHVMVALTHLTYAPGEEVSLPIIIINENKCAIPSAKLELQVLSPSMQVVYTDKQTIMVMEEYQQTYTVPKFKIPGDWKDQFFLIHVALMQDNETLTQSVYWPKALELIKDQAELEKYRSSPQPNFIFDKGPWLKQQIQQAMPATLVCSVQAVNQCGERVSVTVDIENTSEQYTFPVNIDVIEDRTVSYASDNYFLMSPYEKRSLELEIRNKNPELSSMHIEITAWNANSCQVEVNYDSN